MLLAGMLVACLALPLAAETVSFSLLPADGNVSGPAGSTVGWGYQLTNNSATEWFVPTDLDTDSSFSYGTPTLLFDFPDLAPDSTAMETFDPVNGIGLYQFTWDSSAPGGSVNSGNFVLSGEWWDGDPLNGGNFIADAIDTSAAYTARVNTGSSSAPEPSSLAMAMSCLGVLIVVWRTGGPVKGMVR
jgi:hypothetical protein